MTQYDMEDLLGSSGTEWLIKNNQDEVEIESLKGKTVGFYFSATWSRPCQRFTPILIQAYNDITCSMNICDFEIVFVSADEDEDYFDENLSKMPWMAIPFNDSETRSRLDEVFQVKGLPHLAIIYENGELNGNGIQLVTEYGAEAYPFKQEIIQELKQRDENAKTNPSFTSTLLSLNRDRNRNYVLSSHGNQVAMSDLQGKIVGLYFSMFSFKACMEFTPKLVQVYEELRENGESFEIVMIPLDEELEEESFNQCFKTTIPWLSLPFKDKISCRKLIWFFDVSTLPSLVIFGQDGKILHPNAMEAIEEHGVLAFPFTPKRIEDLVRQKEEAQTLESILVSGNLNFVITNFEAEIPVEALVGKNVLLYFTANWSSPCRAFHAEFIKAYENMKAKEDDLEVIFISSDKDEASFKAFFSEMPWLALPYGDSRNASLKRIFKTLHPGVIPKVVAIGEDGRTVSTNVEKLIKVYGAEAYPFTDERLNEVVMEMKKRWPSKLKHRLHEEHELGLECYEVSMFYTCNRCYETGRLLTFRCRECDFDLHPECALRI